MANRAREAGTPSAWFEEFYQWAGDDAGQVPWADGAPHPLFEEWLSTRQLGKVAVIGCGLGDDAERLVAQSEEVWAFDVSRTAVEWARKRFPNTTVRYEEADLFNLPANETNTYDQVIEIYTLQALPPESREAARTALASLLAPGGELVIITRWRRPEDELGPVPWPLLKAELEAFKDLGLQETERTESEPGTPIRSVWQRLR